MLLAIERARRRPGLGQQAKAAFSALERLLRYGETLANTPVSLATRSAGEVCAYTYAFHVDRLLGRAQGRVE